MKTMIYSDLSLVKSYLPQQAFLSVVIALILCFSMGSFYGTFPAVTVAFSFSMLFTIVALDESNKWERFRLSLPLSKRQIIQGRYATALVLTLASLVLASIVFALTVLVVKLGGNSLPFDSALIAQANDIDWMALAIAAGISLMGMLLLSAIILPLTSRFGMTSAVRLAPFIIVAAVLLGSFALSTFGGDIDVLFNDFIAAISTPEGIMVTFLVACAVVLVFFVASCALSTKLYQKREF